MGKKEMQKDDAEKIAGKFSASKPPVFKVVN
jgi:hypothetical protein